MPAVQLTMSVINFVCSVIVTMLAQLHQVHVEVPRVPWKCGHCQIKNVPLQTKCVVCNTDSALGLRLAGPQANTNASGGIFPQPPTFPRVSELVVTSFAAMVFTMFKLRRKVVILRTMAMFRVMMRIPMTMFRVMVWLPKALWQGSRRFIWHIFSSPVALKDTPVTLAEFQLMHIQRLQNEYNLLRQKATLMESQLKVRTPCRAWTQDSLGRWIRKDIAAMELEKNKVQSEYRRLQKQVTLLDSENNKQTKEIIMIRKELDKLQCEFGDVLKMVKTCPITLKPIKDPVICIRDGHRYEREPITQWVEQKGTSPMTRKAVSLDDLIPDTPGAILKAIASNEVCE